MLGQPAPDWRTERRAAASAAILEAAWDLAREHGLAGMSLRDLARRLGMAAPSLYSYFASKSALYDAMFADAWATMLAFEPPGPAQDLRTALWESTDRMVRFAIADPVRYQLMVQRTIPGFVPSPQSYALSQRAYAQGFEPLEAVAQLTQDDRDLVTAFIVGLISQQLANDPGGTRWVRLLDDVVDLLVHRLENKKTRPAPARGRRTKKGER